MSEYGDDDDEWFEDQWYVEDVENLSDTLVSSAYGHEPPYAPEGYDAYDSDIDEYYTDGDDDYFDGPPGSPSPPPTPPKDFPGLPRISSNLVLLTPPTPNIPTPPTPQPAEVAECLSKIEIKFREAMAGKKIYGEAEEGDEKFLRIGVRRRRRRDLAGAGGSKGEEGMRKRRKVEHPGEARATLPVDSGIISSGGPIGIVEIGGRGGAGSEEDEEDNDDGSAEGYNSDGLDGEEESSERRRSLRGEVEIRPPGKPGGGKLAGGAVKRREKAKGEIVVGAGGKRNGEKRRTPLK